MVQIVPFSQAIINYFNINGDFISNKKLQKLLYYIQSWHFVYFDGENLFDDNVLPQAWVHGPVYPSVYEKYKEFSYNPIILKEFKEEKLCESLMNLGIGNEPIELIQVVLNRYGTKSAFELEYLSHSERPWNNARKGLKPYQSCSNTISKEDMESFYKSLVQ